MYLEAISQLRSANRYFTGNKIFRSNEAILTHTSNLLAKAISKLEDEFRQLLTNYRFVFLFFMLLVDNCTLFTVVTFFKKFYNI